MDIVRKYSPICDIWQNDNKLTIRYKGEDLKLNLNLRSYNDTCKVIDTFLDHKIIDVSEFVEYIKSKINIKYKVVEIERGSFSHEIIFTSARIIELGLIMCNNKDKIYKYLDDIIDIELGKNEVINYLGKNIISMSYIHNTSMCIHIIVKLNFEIYNRYLIVTDFVIKSNYNKIIDNNFNLDNIKKIIAYEENLCEIYSKLSKDNVELFEKFIDGNYADIDYEIDRKLTLEKYIEPFLLLSKSVNLQLLFKDPQLYVIVLDDIFYLKHNGHYQITKFESSDINIIIRYIQSIHPWSISTQVS